MTQSRQKIETDGFAIVVILVFLFTVALLVTPFVLNAKSNFLITSNNLKKYELENIADGLFEVTIFRILNLKNPVTPSNQKIQYNGVAQICETASYQYSVRIQDHRGLIDLNSAGSQLTKAGFQALGFSENQAETSSKFIVDSRKVLQSRQSPTQRSLKHRRFLSVVEILNIIPSQPISINSIMSIFTVHSKSGTLNKHKASPLLKAQLNERSITGITERELASFSSGVYTISILIFSKNDAINTVKSKIISLQPAISKTLFSIDPSLVSPLDDEETSDPQLTEFLTCAELFGPSVAAALED